MALTRFVMYIVSSPLLVGGKKGRDVDCNKNMHYTLCVNVADIQDVMLVAVYVVL